MAFKAPINLATRTAAVVYRSRVGAPGRRLAPALLAFAFLACASGGPESAPFAERRLPPMRPMSNDAGVRSMQRRALGDAVEGLDLYRREVADLPLAPEQRRAVDLLFDGIVAWWRPLRAEIDAGQPAPADRVAALLDRIAQTRATVDGMLGPDGAIRLGALRRSPRGVGRQWAAKLRHSLGEIRITRAQVPGVEAAMDALNDGIDALPIDLLDEAAANDTRRRVQTLIAETRGRLRAALLPAQLEDLERLVPTLARPADPATRAIETD